MKYSLKRDCRYHLTHTFGLADYRPGQKEAVYALLSGRDVMCILPTGAGKSLCWQLPAVVSKRLTLVVSPLIALMRDQVQHLHAAGIPAIALDSLMSAEEREAGLERIRTGAVRIVYVSPERLMQPRFRQLCMEKSPWLIVVDEAHCVVQWGEKFRPAYTAIAEFIAGLTARPAVCALTATADAAMQRAIREKLCLNRCKRVTMPIIRGNLVYNVRTTLDRTNELLRLCQEYPEKTVIFCNTRVRTETLTQLLKQRGLSADCYHAGLDRETRMLAQQRFLDGDVQILCATTAFGLGVDIPDIRRVIHDYLPDSVIDYVQQTGRAGRDGLQAECIMLLTPNDLVHKAAFRSYARNPIKRWRETAVHVRKIDQLVRILMAAECIPAGFAAALGKKVPRCGSCSACRNGRLAMAPLSYAFRKEKHIRLWILKWQRAALAAQRSCTPGEVASDRALDMAAAKFTFPADAAVPAELQRLRRHFCRDEMHNSP